MNSEGKNYSMEEFRAIFPITSILVIRSAYPKEGHFTILAAFQNVWYLHKFGLQIWIQNAKLTLWKIFGIFFRFHRFWSSGMRNKDISQYYLYFKMYGIYINLGCRFEFRMQISSYERISGNFSNFIDFCHQVRVCEKRSVFNISSISKCMGFT